MSWTRATEKNIFGRKHENVLSRWDAVYSEAAADHVSLQEHVAEVWGPGSIDASQPAQYMNTPGIESNALSDLIRLKLKADMAWESTGALFSSGRVSWSAVDAHHASVLYARYIAGISGVFAVRHRENWHLLDVFPDLKSGNQKREKKFRQDTVGMQKPVVVVSNGKNKIEQQHIWDLFQRMMRVLSTELLDEREQTWIRNFNFKGYQSVRNKVFYTSHYWPDRQDLLTALVPGCSMESLSEMDNFHENIWINSENRDHVLLSIMREIGEKMSPNYLKRPNLQESLAA